MFQPSIILHYSSLQASSARQDTTHNLPSWLFLDTINSNPDTIEKPIPSPAIVTDTGANCSIGTTTRLSFPLSLTTLLVPFSNALNSMAGGCWLLVKESEMLP